MPVFYKSSAQNAHRAEDFCSIIIETCPAEDLPPEDTTKSLITKYHEFDISEQWQHAKTNLIFGNSQMVNSQIVK